MDGQLWLLAHGLPVEKGRDHTMRQYGEIHSAIHEEYSIRGILQDLLGLALAVGSALALLFLAGGV